MVIIFRCETPLGAIASLAWGPAGIGPLVAVTTADNLTVKAAFSCPCHEAVISTGGLT